MQQVVEINTDMCMCELYCMSLNTKADDIILMKLIVNRSNRIHESHFIIHFQQHVQNNECTS